MTRPDGSLLAGGEQARNAATSRTSSTTSRRAGPDLFINGEVGRGLIAEMAAGGGLVTAEDLAAYRPVVRPAHVLDVGDWSIATNPPPSVGGPMLAAMLSELARRGDWTWSDALEIQHAC